MTPPSKLKTILIDGFENLKSTTNNAEGTKLEWYCAPDSWTQTDESKREGRDGKWFLVDNDNEPQATNSSTALVLFPPAKKDFWRHTYYLPVLIKDDGPVLYATLKRAHHYTVETTFQLTAVSQFDQAGLFLRLDKEHWLKTGIEVVDQKARLSCVVTNIYSDWSTQPWPSSSSSSTTAVGTQQQQQQQLVDCAIRIHCRGTSFVVEAKQPSQQSVDDASGWEFLRIANLNDTIVATNEDPSRKEDSAWAGPEPADKDTFWAGVFACCPEDQKGGHATFTSFRIVEGSSFDHNAKSNLE